VAARFAVSDQSLWSRLLVWRDSVGIVRGFPLTGAGLGTFRLVFPHYHVTAGSGTYFEAHNDYLQLLTEGGLLVVLPVLLLAMRFGLELIRRVRASTYEGHYWTRVGAAMGIVAMGVQETVEFSLRSPAAAVLFVVCCSLAIHEPSGRH